MLKKIFLYVLFSGVFIAANAQVNVCKGSDGKNVYTNLSCEKLHANQISVIEDIPTEPKECPGLKKQIESTKQSAIDARRLWNPTSEVMAWSQTNVVNSLEARYAKECVK